MSKSLAFGRVVVTKESHVFRPSNDSGAVEAEERTALRQRIISEIRRLAKSGVAPGFRRFRDATGLTTFQIQKFWPTWGAALTEAGYSPNKMSSAAPPDEIFGMLAEWIKRERHFPSVAEMNHAASQPVPDLPYDSTLRKRWGNRRGIIEAFRRWLADKPEYTEIQEILKHHDLEPIAVPESSQPQIETALSPLSDSIIPPVIESLSEFARATPRVVQYCRHNGIDENVEFERRVALAFRIIGFSVETLGQGSGRVADGIAKCIGHGWAIIYDAKIRTAGYKLLTEDRKFREYIERHGKTLGAEGIRRLYFAVVSSTFAESDVEKVRELVRLTDAKSCVFVEADALRRVAERRLLDSIAFTLDDVERAFMTTGILRAKNL